MQVFTYPSSAELSLIDPIKLAKLTMDDFIFNQFPIRETKSSLVIWEQRDNYRGLMQLRGLNGEPPQVPTRGSKRYMKQPSAFGEYDLVDEMELTTRAAPGTFNIPINIDDLVTDRQDLLMNRQVNRMRWILWTIIVKGVYSILGPTGAIIDQDSYAPQRITGSNWATASSATPLADLRAVSLKHRGQSASFGSASAAAMNQQTFNYMIANTNANDLGAHRTGLVPIDGQAGFNALAMRDGLPQVAIYDEDYLSDGTDGNAVDSTQLFLPDYYVAVFGKRTNNAKVGEFLLTRNATNPNMGGAPYSSVWDSADHGNEPPRKIKVHRGFNGGPAVYYPGSIVILYVGP